MKASNHPTFEIVASHVEKEFAFLATQYACRGPKIERSSSDLWCSMTYEARELWIGLSCDLRGPPFIACDISTGADAGPGRAVDLFMTAVSRFHYRGGDPPGLTLPELNGPDGWALAVRYKAALLKRYLPRLLQDSAGA